MAKKQIPLAIAYDFDGTLAPGNMQERNFIPEIGMKSKQFWNEVKSLCKEHQADNILIYMQLMLRKAAEKNIPVFKKNFSSYGKQLDLFPGVEDWFSRINLYGKQSNVKVEHFIISSGIREMIAGTKISSKFKKIYASSYVYDHHGVPVWPALAVNYTHKTQYLFRINKGALDIDDNSTINNFVSKEDRPVPFSNMIFIGDGETDVPCFRLVKDQGGNSIVVYKGATRGAKAKALKLLNEEGRANFAAVADYREGSELDKIVKALIDKIQIEADVNQLKRASAQ